MVTKNKSDLDRLQDQFSRYPSLEKFQLYRNMCFGAGAACLVLMLQLIGVANPNVWQTRSLAACIISMPLWLCVGGLFELYIMLGPKSYPHYRSKFTNGSISGLLLIAGLGLASSIGLLLYGYMPWASYLFIGSIVVSLVVSLAFNWHLAHWYFKSHPEDGSAPGA